MKFNDYRSRFEPMPVILFLEKANLNPEEIRGSDGIYSNLGSVS